jgi:hypothetical protein
MFYRNFWQNYVYIWQGDYSCSSRTKNSQQLAAETLDYSLRGSLISSLMYVHLC